MKLKLVDTRGQSHCLGGRFDDIPDLEDDIFAWYQEYLANEEVSMDDLCVIVNSHHEYTSRWIYHRSNCKRIQLRCKTGATLDDYVLLIYLEEE